MHRTLKELAGRSTSKCHGVRKLQVDRSTFRTDLKWETKTQDSKALAGNIGKRLRSPAIWFYNSHDNPLRASTDIKLTKYFFFFENIHPTGTSPATKIQTLLSVNFKTNLNKQARCLDKHILPKSTDKKHRQCQEERAASRLGGIHGKNGGRCKQDENFMEFGQKVFLYVTMETAALVPRGRTSLRQLLRRVL